MDDLSLEITKNSKNRIEVFTELHKYLDDIHLKLKNQIKETKKKRENSEAVLIKLLDSIVSRFEG